MPIPLSLPQNAPAAEEGDERMEIFLRWIPAAEEPLVGLFNPEEDFEFKLTLRETEQLMARLALMREVARGMETLEDFETP